MSAPPQVLCVFGTRPEAIKMAPVVRALGEPGSGLAAVVCVTGQHREMLDEVLDLFALQPRYRLDVMRPDQSPAEVAAAVLRRLPPVLERVRPAAMLVQGDTTTTVAAALAAFYAGVPVGHVEAGLRTGRLDSPFPEEAHRRFAGLLARWHFAPTAEACANLLAEGVPAERIVVTGNTAVDAVHWAAARLRSRPVRCPVPVRSARRLILVTAHRRESFGPPLVAICRAVRQLVERNPDVEVAFPVHPNPRVRGTVHRLLGGQARLHLLPPVGYLEIVDLLRRCDLLLTDSGGLQEEAPSLGKPVLVLRDTTERLEGIAAGAARLVGRSAGRIVAETERLLRDPAAYAAARGGSNPYGDGRASGRIVRALRRGLGTGGSEAAGDAGQALEASGW